MIETVLNWLVLLTTGALFVGVAWMSYRDLRATSPEPAPSPSATIPFMEEEADLTPGDRAGAEPEPGGARMRVQYSRGGLVELTQWITDAGEAHLGTEAAPMLAGQGILVRHLSVTHDGAGFLLRNRDATRPVRWEDRHETGELLPLETMPLGDGKDLLLGEWTLVCNPFDGEENAA